MKSKFFFMFIHYRQLCTYIKYVFGLQDQMDDPSFPYFAILMKQADTPAKYLEIMPPNFRLVNVYRTNAPNNNARSISNLRMQTSTAIVQAASIDLV